MTRLADRTPPAVTRHVLHPDAPMAAWPYQPVIAVERLPQPAYTWDDPDATWDAFQPGTGTPGYLTPTVGTVTTPDPGPLPNLCTFVFKVRAAGASTDQTVVGQMEGGTNGFAWNLRRYFPSGQLVIGIYPNGTGTGAVSRPVNAQAPTGADEHLALSYTINNGSGLSVLTSRRSTDGGATWTQLATSSPATLTPFDASTVLRVGAFITNSQPWQGRIYSVELRTGLDPAAGTVVWRFDASDYPGTGTVYTDPRGRVWTLTNATAITPAVPATPLFVWDAPFIGAGFTDALCDLIALELNPGEPDELGLLPACEATVTLANTDGAYTVWSADGRMIYWAPGRELCVWAHRHADATDWWLFRGRVASWQQNADATVTIVAHDGIGQLAEDMAGEWTPGTAGQTARARLEAIAAQAGYTDPIGGDSGDVALATEPGEGPPIDAMHRAALSDGGVIAVDADGTLLYRNRLWRAGRADQPRVWAMSDNVCGPDLINVWDLELGPDDLGLATSVELINLAGLTATAQVDPGSTAALWVGRRYRLTHPDPDLWTTQGDGDSLAGYLLAQSSTPVLAARRWVMHLHDLRQPDLFAAGVELRRGDRVELLHDYPDADGTPATMDVYVVVWGMHHAVAADTWTVTPGGTRTVDWRQVEQWDRTRFAWDQVDPANVWRY